MPTPAMLRDSTQIVLPFDAVEDHLGAITGRFTVSVHVEDTCCRLVGSPVEIKRVNEFLTHRGVVLS